MKHIVNPEFHKSRINVELIGGGGTGSLVLSGLVRLHLAMLSLEHPGGLHVRVWDDDTVSRANIGRQLFVQSEIGLNKAAALVNRCNLHFGLDWEARPCKFKDVYGSNRNQVLISCVDTRASRAGINRCVSHFRNCWVIDSGNGNSFGQVVAGNGSKELPYPYKRIPGLIDVKVKENRRSSCSLAEALFHQELFINQWMATAVLEILWQLFRKGGLNYAGFYINLENGKMTPIPITRAKLGAG